MINAIEKRLYLEEEYFMSRPNIHCNKISAELLTVAIEGDWLISSDIPPPGLVLEQALLYPVKGVAFTSVNLTDWDSSILTFLIELSDRLEKEGIKMTSDGLPDGIRQLLSLASAVPRNINGRSGDEQESFFERTGKNAILFVRSAGELISFIGETSMALGRLLRGKAKFRSIDLRIFLLETGASAVPIVSLISFLFGFILAFVGILQLELFGAQVYVADLVGIAVVRVMGAVMTGIIMAGRTGAAFAAQLGTMQVNEEIDALETLAISPVEFLVLPRMLALTLMMPLLTLYADLMGILGGALIACSLYGINVVTYFNRVRAAVSLNDLFIGLFMGLVFGVLVALSGCLRGIQCGRDASAVGKAATSAVVTSLVVIIIATAVIIMISAVLGI